MTYDFGTLTGTIQTTHFNSNFADLNNKFGNIYSVDLHPRAGIVAGQLRDRYSSWVNEFNLVPFQSDATWDAGANQFTFPATMTRFKRRRIKTTGNLILLLASVEIFAEDVSTTPFPRVELRKNGSLIVGSQFDLDTDNNFFTNERTTDPLANPVEGFSNNDTIEYWIGSSTGLGAPACRGVYVTENWKSILIP